MKLVDFRAPNCGGFEYVSVCEKQHHYYKLNMTKWRQASLSYSRPSCDICEFDEGRFPERLKQLQNEGLID